MGGFQRGVQEKVKRSLFRTVTDYGIQIIVRPYRVEQDARYSRHLAMIFPTRSQLIRELSLTQTDLAKIAKCRGDPQRLGFAYQLGFVRVFQRFPVQQPLEICEELLSYLSEPQLRASGAGC